jgi:hypothetical protein
MNGNVQVYWKAEVPSGKVAPWRESPNASAMHVGTVPREVGVSGVAGVEGVVDGVEGVVDGVEGVVDGVEGVVDGVLSVGGEGVKVLVSVGVLSVGAVSVGVLSVGGASVVWPVPGRRGLSGAPGIRSPEEGGKAELKASWAVALFMIERV